ncbi:DNA alkylation repair protein [Candidatus Omnitrophota bacterium]
MTAQAVRRALKKQSNKRKAKILQRFFKTGPGEYGEGDVFIGVVVPQIRKVVQQFDALSLAETVKLLQSSIHEERLAALLILVKQYAVSSQQSRKKIYTMYLKHTQYINNWDLIDLTAAHIVGAFLFDKSKKPLFVLARSPSLWERRIAILSTFHYIKHGRFDVTLVLAKRLLTDKEDLIHKAVGWMLREVGKRNRALEERFLKKHYRKMARTMLRYAIEKFPEAERQAYLKGRV